jgi:hypothetical protein
MGKDDEIRTIAPKQFRHNEFIMKLFKDRVLLTISHILYYTIIYDNISYIGKSFDSCCRYALEIQFKCCNNNRSDHSE